MKCGIQPTPVSVHTICSSGKRSNTPVKIIWVMFDVVAAKTWLIPPIALARVAALRMS